MHPVLNTERFHPFVRCVGATSKIYQQVLHKAYDYRLLAILDGEGTVYIDEKEYISEKGNIYIISPGTGYRVISGKGQRIVVINFDMTCEHCRISSPVISVGAELFDKEKIIERNTLPPVFSEKVFIRKEMSSECMKLCQMLLDAYRERSIEIDSVYLTGLFTQLFCHLLRTDEQTHINSAAKELYKYITENFHQPITLEELGEKFHFHPTYVNRLLKKHYGTSARQLILKCRFDRAIYLLDHTDMSVKEVAQESGFPNPQYFSLAFFNHFGVYPSSFRK